MLLKLSSFRSKKLNVLCFSASIPSRETARLLALTREGIQYSRVKMFPAVCLKVQVMLYFHIAALIKAIVHVRCLKFLRLVSDFEAFYKGALPAEESLVER